MGILGKGRRKFTKPVPGACFSDVAKEGVYYGVWLFWRARWMNQATVKSTPQRYRELVERSGVTRVQRQALPKRARPCYQRHTEGAGPYEVVKLPTPRNVKYPSKLPRPSYAPLAN